MIKALIFDMDGTLLVSNDLVMKIYETLTSLYGPKVALSHIENEYILAKGYPEIIDILYQDQKDFYIEKIYEIHQKISKPYLSLYEDTIKLLDFLKNHNIQIFLVTSELRRITENQLKYLNIYTYFDEIVAFDDVKEPKPSPLGINYLMNKYHLNNESVLFVGDSITDGLASKAAMIRSVYMNHHHQNEKTIYFDLTMYSLDELLSYIDSMIPAYTLNLGVQQSLKIVQFTDLHLMNNESDINTFNLLDQMIMDETPNLIVFTGDQTMSKDSEDLYEKLALFMEEKNIPWGLVFGNHDTDYDVSYESLIKRLNGFKQLKFKPGYIKFGYSNYFIEVKYQHKVDLIFMLDSHVSDTYDIDGKDTWGYGLVSDQQVMWVLDIQQSYQKLFKDVNSLIFFHIPPYEVKLVNQNDLSMYQDVFDETPSTPPVPTNLFKMIQDKGFKGIFYGHDHYNDFSYVLNHIMLAYGRVSGYYEYGNYSNAKGARIILLYEDGRLDSYIRLVKKVK